MSEPKDKGKFIELKFSHDLKSDQYSIGSGKEADVKLEPKLEIAPVHAIIKRSDELTIPSSPSENRTKIERITKFMMNFHVKSAAFKVQNESQYGTLIYRRQEFLVTPNTMELFQFGNLLLQLSRY